jgi:hypothetical protein
MVRYKTETPPIMHTIVDVTQPQHHPHIPTIPAQKLLIFKKKWKKWK